MLLPTMLLIGLIATLGAFSIKRRTITPRPSYAPVAETLQFTTKIAELHGLPGRFI